MTKLALIRHGPTAYNKTRRLQGLRDVPLSEQGRIRVQNYDIPSELQGFTWITSPLVRASETARLLTSDPVAIDTRLVEMDWGSWEGRTVDDLRAELGQAMRENENRGLDFCPADGESPRDVMRRVHPLLVDIGKSGRNTAAVTHKGVIRAIYAAALDWDMLGEPPHKLDWFSTHMFAVSNRGNLKVLALNIPLSQRTETVEARSHGQ